MTIIEIVSKLLEFYVSNTIFEPQKDFSKIFLISDTDGQKAAVLVALEELIKQGFIVKKEFEGHDYYILQKPIAMFSQNVSISVALGLEIAELLNNTILSDSDKKCNPTAITEEEIFHLVMLIKSNLSDDEDGDDGEEEGAEKNN